jgi:hypothetical protein
MTWGLTQARKNEMGNATERSQLQRYPVFLESVGSAF